MTWPPLPFEQWQATCDTLHAHTQVLGKLSLALAPAEPQLQHTALRLTVRGWETLPLPAPDGSGRIGIALDLRRFEAVVEHDDGRAHHIPLIPDRSVAAVTHDVLAAVDRLAGHVEISMKPQETPWETPLDEDTAHSSFDATQVARYFDAAARAALVLAEFRAPYRGRATPVNAWWGAFDLAVDLFSGEPAEPPSRGFLARNSMDAQQIAVGWWPGDSRYRRPAFYGYVHPAPDGLREEDLSPGRWDTTLGEFVLDWDELIAMPAPHKTALTFCRGFADFACVRSGWDPVQRGSLKHVPPPVT
jgi:hypothetical protein